MQKVPPDNLGKRQYELNQRVNDAFAKENPCAILEEEKEVTELDKFFKIDLAAKCKNVDYIIGVFKSGETLYVHRALKKCNWIYNDEYSDIINPAYLDNTIFTVTSNRVKRLILKTVVMHMRQGRAVAFYQYCMKNKMIDMALKCFLFTSEEFRLEELNNKNEALVNEIQRKKLSYLRFLIGNSYELLNAYIKALTKDHEKTILMCKYFYPLDNAKYLELLEKYVDVDDLDILCNPGKISDEMGHHIMRKHKDRVLANPLFYLKIIHTDVLTRHMTADDAKVLIVSAFPPSVDEFWDFGNHGSFRYGTGKIFLKQIPHSEIYELLKKIFNEKYPYEEFETSAPFYNEKYYEYMTPDQQEQLALNQIKSERQVLGVGNDYLWYRFVNFKVAFEEMKKYIIITKEADKRNNMLITLVKSVRNCRELETFFKYYYKRHINESKPDKANFLDEVIENQKVFEFDEGCWTEFYKIMLSLEIYKDLYNDIERDYYKKVALYYNILNKKELPDDLMGFLLNDYFPFIDEYNLYISADRVFKKLSIEKQRFLFNYLYTFYTDKIEENKNKPYTHESQSKSQQYFKIVMTLLEVFNVNAKKIQRSHMTQRKRTRAYHQPLSDRQLLLDLKKNTSLVVGKLGDLTESIRRNDTMGMNNFLRKIKIYFPNDITETFCHMYEEIVSEGFQDLGQRSVDACMSGVFQLAEESWKIELMQKYVPENTKIDFGNDDTRIIEVRKAICRHASNAIPPVPLTNLLAYLKGDYARFCLHVFSVYVAALPMSACIKLVHSVLESPVSIQKHALRLAVQCFSAESLKNTIKDIWNKTKHVSLRSIMYKSLFNRIVNKNESELYDCLISFTLDLKEDDQKVIFDLVYSNTLPIEILGEFYKAAWTAIGEFKNKEPNISRKKNVINGIRTYLNVMDKEFVRDIIDKHLNTMFIENKLELNYSKEHIAALYVGKWDLTVKYILTGSCDDEPRKYVELTQNIVKNCLKSWKERRSDHYIYQYCCWEFIQNLNDKSIEYCTQTQYFNQLYEAIHDMIQAALPLHEIYIHKWEMQLAILNWELLKNENLTLSSPNRDEIVRDLAMHFGKEVGKLVLEYVANKSYFTSLSDKICEVTLKSIEQLLKVAFASSDEDCKKYLDVAVISLAVALLEFETMETALLAAHIMPTEINDCDEYSRDKYQLVIEYVLTCPHPEVQSTAYLKLHKPFQRIAPAPKNRKKASPVQKPARNCQSSRRGKRFIRRFRR